MKPFEHAIHKESSIMQIYYKPALIALSIVFIASCTLEDVADETISSCPTSFDPATPFLDDFEDDSINDTSKWHIEGDVFFSDVVETTTDLTRSGNQAVRFFHRASATDGQGVKRAEITHYNNDPVCSEVYYAWSFYIDPAYSESRDGQIMGQWHARPEYGESYDTFKANGPPISMRLDSKDGINNLRMYIIDQQGRLLNSTSKIINFGVWIDLVFHIKWSPFSDGFVEAWISDDTTGGTLVPFTPFNNATSDYKMFSPTIFNSAGNYIKLGVYRGPYADTPATVYFDDFRIVNSFDEAISP